MQTNSCELSSILNLPLSPKDNIINYIAIDSRAIFNPTETLFIAIEGSKTSGTNYIPDLIKLGVKHFLVSSQYQSKFSDTDAGFYFVENTINALQKLIIFKRNQSKIKTIGITGSNGKTIVKEWLSQLLNGKFKVVKSPKSYNSQLGVPLSIWGQNESHNLAIYEAGISKTDEMSRLEKMIKPEIGILTHLGDAHQSNFNSLDDKLRQKLLLFKHSEILIIKNSLVAQYNYAFKDLKNDNPELKLYTWGDSKHSDLNIRFDTQNARLIVEQNDQNWSIKTSHSEPTYIENLSHCITTLVAMGENLSDYISELENLSSIEMRLEIIEGNYNTTLINDTYNADIDSLKIALQFLNQQAVNSSKSIILSEIIDTGFQPINEIFSLLENKKFHQLVLIGSAYENQISRFQKLEIDSVYYYPSTQDFISKHIHQGFKDNTILVKGARKFELEKIVQLYRTKTHSTYLKIHLNAIKHNLTEFAKIIDPGTKIMVMLKANGYGLGSVELAKILESERVDYYAVAYTDEGVELRNAGIHKPILVLNPEVSALDKLIEYQLEPEIYSFDILKTLVSEISKNKYSIDTTISIHLKLETGMHRLGIEEKDIDSVLNLIESTPSLHVNGVLSHLSGTDDKKWAKFTRSQIEVFNGLSSFIEERLGYKTIKHILNSGGVINYSEHQFDMVRIGIGLYGFDSSQVIQEKLQTTTSLITKIAQIKTLNEGESTGYSRSGMASKETKIAIVNLGYADGYSRAFGNGVAHVFIQNQYAPTIGNICMDMTMIDITDLKNITIGDEVEMMGEHILASDLAEKSKTISYEILTGISERVQRVYWED
jgi:Alr-MurF fusion protein